MLSSSTRQHTSVHAKGFALSTALWLFGLFTSLVLIGLWGRTVAGDELTLAASTRAVLESEVVNDRVSDWLEDAVAAAAELGSDDVAAVVAVVEGTPEMEAAMDDIVDQAVAAALAPPGTVAEIDLAAAAEVLAPVVANALAERGVIAEASTVQAAAQNLPGIVLSADDGTTVGGAARQVKGWLTTVVVVGLAGMVTFGGAAVMLSSDRVRQLRALVVRLGVSAFTFAIVFRIGAWAVDPDGGRSPIASGGAVLLKSNGHILAIVAVAAAVVAGGMSVFVLRRQRSQPAIDEPAAVGESTDEQPVLVGVPG